MSKLLFNCPFDILIFIGNFVVILHFILFGGKNMAKKIALYIISPIAFLLGGYLLLYIALSPVIKTIESVGGMMLQEDAPSFDSSLSVIYDPNAHVGKNGEKVSFEDIHFPSQGEQYAQIECSDLGLNAPVYWGDTYSILKYGVGQYMGSFIPGYGKPILLCAHNTTFFYCFKDVKEGMKFTITTNWGKYEYEVTDLEVIKADDENKVNEWLAGDDEKLMMYTCYPIDGTYGEKAERFFVMAKKLSGPVIE